MADPNSTSEIVTLLIQCAALDEFRLTLHAHQEMLDENVTVANVREAMSTPEIIENYTEHQRGACCLMLGWTASRRPLHIVCTSHRSPVVIITVYEPKAPKWVSPRERRKPS
jgi:hypothetical protein